MIKKILAPTLIRGLMPGIILGIILVLPGCDALSVKSALLETCEEIAKDRLRYPSSFDKTSAEEYNNAQGHKSVNIAFTAWNGFKVPIPYRITCVFGSAAQENLPLLISIAWNGRQIRAHELDDIRQKLKE